jgi:osmotically-inducible protein OsmY
MLVKTDGVGICRKRRTQQPGHTGGRNLPVTGRATRETVSYGTERAAAEAAVAGLAGVRNVIDYIEISYGTDPVDVDLHVQEALERSALVPDGSEAWMARGVIDVRDELQITG